MLKLPFLSSSRRIAQAIRLRVLLAAVAALAACSTAQADDLLEILDLALENDDTLRAARFFADADALRPEITRTSILPRVELSATGRREETRLSESEELFGGFTVRQPIWNSTLKPSLEASEIDAEIAEIEYRIAERDLYLRVAERYFSVLAAKDNLQTVEREVAAITEFRQLARQRMVVGLGTSADFNDAEARLSRVVASEIQAQHQIQTANLLLGELIGGVVPELGTLADDIVIADLEQNQMQWWRDTALNNNIEITVARAAVERARAEIAVESARSGASVNFVANHQESFSGDGAEDDRQTFSVVATIPIYQGGVVSKRTRQASLTHKARVRELAAATSRISSNVASAFLNVRRHVSQVQALEDAKLASESALQAKEEGYAVGINTTLDVLNAQSVLFAIIRDLKRARYEYFLSVVQLEGIAGTLDRSDFETLNQSLQ